MGTVHGGILCDLADVAMGAALATATAEGESFATLQLQMSYLAAGARRPAAARAPACCTAGSSAAHLECDLHDGEGRLVARATSVAAIQRPS